MFHTQSYSQWRFGTEHWNFSKLTVQNYVVDVSDCTRFSFKSARKIKPPLDAIKSECHLLCLFGICNKNKRQEKFWVLIGRWQWTVLKWNLLENFVLEPHVYSCISDVLLNNEKICWFTVFSSLTGNQYVWYGYHTNWLYVWYAKFFKWEMFAENTHMFLHLASIIKHEKSNSLICLTCLFTMTWKLQWTCLLSFQGFIYIWKLYQEASNYLN